MRTRRKGGRVVVTATGTRTKSTEVTEVLELRYEAKLKSVLNQD